MVTIVRVWFVWPAIWTIASKCYHSTRVIAGQALGHTHKHIGETGTNSYTHVFHTLLSTFKRNVLLLFVIQNIAELVMEYAHRHREKQNYTCVYWIDCTTHDTARICAARPLQKMEYLDTLSDLGVHRWKTYLKNEWTGMSSVVGCHGSKQD